MKKTFFSKMDYKKWIIVLLLLAVLGYILNIISRHRYFYFNQVFLFTMLIIQLFVLKKINSLNSEINNELFNAKEHEVQGSFYAKTKKLIGAKKIKIIAIILVILYILTMFRIGCLEYNITGLYGGFLGGIVFYIGIQAYVQYLMLLYFCWDLKNVHIKNYFFYMPALTDWIVKLAHEISFIEKWFLILGLMYSCIYAINIPSGSIIISSGISIQTSSNFLFYITWIGVIIFFAIAVPVFTFLGRYYIKNCIYMCKCRSIKLLKNQISILSNNTSEDDLGNIQAKLLLIKEISSSADYPLKYKRTIFDSFYTVCLALLTLVSPFSSIIEQLFFKG